MDEDKDAEVRWSGLNRCGIGKGPARASAVFDTDPPTTEVTASRHASSALHDGNLACLSQLMLLLSQTQDLPRQSTAVFRPLSQVIVQHTAEKWLLL